MARGPKKTLLQATTLAQLADGYVGRIVDAELEAIQKDLDDRGADGKPRTLTIKLSLVPEGNGVVDIRANVTKGGVGLQAKRAQADHGAEQSHDVALAQLRHLLHRHGAHAQHAFGAHVLGHGGLHAGDQVRVHQRFADGLDFAEALGL
jgi:hypothetical protein